MIPLVTASDLVRELTSGATSSKGALAFDGDGTLWSGDVGEDFFFGVLDSGLVTDLATREVTRIAKGANIDTAGSVAEIARRIYDTYLRGEFDEQHVCEIMTWICAGWTGSHTAAFALELVGNAFAERIHPEVRAVITGARELGHEIFVVSASPRPIVEAAAAVAGIAPSHVLAATAVLENGRFVPAVQKPIPYGAGKASALESVLGTTPLLAAFGDNAFDEQMLVAAERPIAVRPKARLVTRAASIPGLRELCPLE